ncbi:hypothetical protein AALP_AA6G243400 [Arabis alpina]|uniref:Uncharacterized protein n=1 Tax=Arabis alpina TaxID=50452 RepID=A0A087GRE8_ARAAL|nr:hypothetical protein AALP_AA6G243400 [Arabis alpina]
MGSIDSDDSDINRFETRISDRALASSSQLTRKRDEDEDEEEVSDQETKLIKKPRTSTTTLVTSPTPWKITWTKNDELLILKEQINENVELAKEDLTNVEHEQVNENVAQAEELTCVEHEQITEHIEQAKSNENVEQAEDVTHVEREQVNENMAQAEDATYVEHEQITENLEQTKVDDGENETNNEKVGAEEFSILQDAFEATLFPRLDTTHQKLMLENLRNLKAEKGKELSEEWRALLVEEIKFNVKKLAFSAKLADA